MSRTKPRNPVSRFFRMLVEARWFFAMTASLFATITGISLTFGINSCRENQRKESEMCKSMLQAVGNIGERYASTSDWLSLLEKQNRLYFYVDSLHYAGIELSDSICEEFRYSLPIVRLSAFDHEFEKIFRGSYQLWQVQEHTDSLTYFISDCYDGINIVEATCEELTQGMLDQISIINTDLHFYRQKPKEWTLTMIEDPRFQYFMSIRRAKTETAAFVLSQVDLIYQSKVLPRSEKLKR